MKKLFLLSIIFYLVMEGASGQSCLPEGIIFTTQAQIDSFQVNYPGCTWIEGNVKIWSSGITNFNGLSTINHIDGRLYITNCSGLENLSGLQNIDTIEGDLQLKSNLNLTSLTGLENLKFIGGNLEIFNNTDLENINGFQSLMHIGGFLTIAVADSLRDLAGLESLSVIGSALEISSNKTLEGLDGLENLMSIGSYLKISFNPLLTSISSLQNLDPNSVLHLYLYENHSLSICNEPLICNYLSSPIGSLNIYNNAPGCNNPSEIADSCGITLSCLPHGNYYFLSQDDIDNFQINYPNCTVLQGNVNVNESDATNLSGINLVTSISGNLKININNTLPNLSGLENLNYIGGDFEILGNESMTSTIGIENLDSIAGNLVFGGNPVLEDLFGFEGLNYIGRYLEINGNDSLKSLNGLNNLQQIDGGLIITYAFSLKDLQGLNNLDTIREGIGLFWNDSLESLTALGNVKLARAFNINGNYLLTSLLGLDNINPDSIYWLKILNNYSLSECDIKSICGFLSTGDTNVDIQFNNAGCFNREEVEEACCVGVDEPAARPDSEARKNIGHRSSGVCYPNPVSDQVTFRFQLEEKSDVNVVVYNSLGQCVTTISEEKLPADRHEIIWNVCDVPAGIYLYRITAGNLSYSGNLVVMK